MRKNIGRAFALLLVGLAASSARGADEVSVEGYADWRVRGCLIVDGQRLCPDPKTKFKGEGEATSFSAIPLGYEVKARGPRRPDGAIVPKQVEAKPNGLGMIETTLTQSFDETERKWLRAGSIYEEDAEGHRKTIGELLDSGSDVERVRSITRRLLPPHIDEAQVRSYVVRNREWNAMAAPNYSLYVFDGLLRDMDDDEVAIIVGHEIAHASHEHSRRHFKKQMLIQLGLVAATAAAEQIEGEKTRLAAQVAAILGASAWANGYGRRYEDQADRVGLRYAYEAGYDIRKGPALWARFARKYGDTPKALNFFFGDHSVAKDRQKNLEQELAINYGEH